MSVSYTHLDVYKRQGLVSRACLSICGIVLKPLLKKQERLSCWQLFLYGLCRASTGHLKWLMQMKVFWHQLVMWLLHCLHRLAAVSYTHLEHRLEYAADTFGVKIPSNEIAYVVQIFLLEKWWLFGLLCRRLWMVFWFKSQINSINKNPVVSGFFDL